MFRMTNKKLIFGALTILILSVGGFSTWKLLVGKSDSLGPEAHSYFICPDGSQHGPGVPGEGVQEWCKRYGFVISGENTTEAVITVSGYVINGGDTTPEGLVDAPRKFIYTIQKDDDSKVDITYTAYPPSPAGDREREKIRLSFHAGTIQIGDYLNARGTFDAKTNVLAVANEGD